MADFVFNIALGRVKQYYDNVENNSPANSAFVVVLIETTGLEADGTLRDYDDLGALLTAANNEQTAQARKVLTDVELSAIAAPDDTNNRWDADIPDITWTALTGNAISKLLICYDSDTTAGTDSNIVPVTAHDFVITPDGSDVTAQINAAGFYRAQG